MEYAVTELDGPLVLVDVWLGSPVELWLGSPTETPSERAARLDAAADIAADAELGPVRPVPDSAPTPKQPSVGEPETDWPVAA